MASRKENMIPGQISGETPKSKVDLFSGEHTTSILVAVLFAIVFSGLVIYLCSKDKPENLVMNGFFSLLSLLGGFFAGSRVKK